MMASLTSFAHFLAASVNVEVVIKTPFVACFCLKAPVNSRIAGPETDDFVHFFACMYTLSKPKTSCLIIPSMPSSPVLPFY